MRTRDSIHRKEESDSSVPVVLSTNPENNPATSALLASSSTTVAEFIAIEPSTISEHAKSVAHVRSDHNAPVPPSGALSSTRTDPPDNVRGELVNTPEFAKAQRRERGGGLVRGAEESDRIAALASAETQVRARAVLPGSGHSEHQATGAASIRQPTTPVLPATT